MPNNTPPSLTFMLNDQPFGWDMEEHIAQGPHSNGKGTTRNEPEYEKEETTSKTAKWRESKVSGLLGLKTVTDSLLHRVHLYCFERYFRRI